MSVTVVAILSGQLVDRKSWWFLLLVAFCHLSLFFVLSCLHYTEKDLFLDTVCFTFTSTCIIAHIS